MSELFASGRIVDLVLAVTALEGLVLILYRRRTGRGLPAADVISLLLPGVLLMLALRSALTGDPWTWIVAFLLAALATHLADLRRRWPK